MKEGIIYKALSGFYYVKTNTGEIYQTRARGKFRNDKLSPLVGDRVKFAADNLKEGYISEILPRKNELKRPLVANINQALIVTSLVTPDYADLLLDKMLLSVEFLKIEPIIYFSKVDLIGNQDFFLPIKQKYQKIGYKVFDNLDDKEQLKQLLANKLTVVMGQSGAGKSTLLNCLLGDDRLAVGEISKALGRGRHTTRHTELVEIANGYLADTPGFSSLELQTMEPQDLTKCFPEFEKYSSNCKFRGCLHLQEPKCAVKEALREGLIAKSRYESYQEFIQEIKQQKKY